MTNNSVPMFFAAVPASYEGESAAPSIKTYSYGRNGDMTLTTHVNGDVSVYYAPSCICFHVEKDAAQSAWNFVNERKHHLRQIGC